MNIEEKIKRYDEAIERAKKWLNAPNVSKIPTFANRVIEEIFPELKESEDEKMKKIISDILIVDNDEIRKILDSNDVLIQDVWAWLEKQGKTFTKKDVDDAYLKGVCDAKQELEKQGEQKPTDKPKFKVGDILVSDEEDKRHIYKVNAITNYDTYLLLDLEYGYTRNESIYTSDLAMYLWTIQDANPGDVLVCNINKAEIGSDIEKLPNITPTICVYQNVVKDKDYIHTYCSLYNGSSLVLSNSMYYNTFVYNIQPATKEQRELLFKKMKEAGYEWNLDTKELKKIGAK